MDVRSCAARLAIFPSVTGGGSLLLSATSPVMGISSRADRVYQLTIIILLLFSFFSACPGGTRKKIVDFPPVSSRATREPEGAQRS
jgi:hypothetical protein